MGGGGQLNKKLSVGGVQIFSAQHNIIMSKTYMYPIKNCDICLFFRNIFLKKNFIKLGRYPTLPLEKTSAITKLTVYFVQFMEWQLGEMRSLKKNLE